MSSGREEEKVTVAGFIEEAIGNDGFCNSVYKRIYDAYMDLYYEGFPQEEIVKKMAQCADRELAGLIVDLSTEKYQLTIKSFSNALTTTSSWLVVNVPKAIMVYQERRLQSRIEDIRGELASASAERQAELLKEMIKIQSAQRRINQRVGRERTI